MEKNENKQKSSIDSLLDKITPEQQARTDNRMMLAVSIADAMEEKGWNNKRLMEALGKKNPSEITRWLSGTHNFTIDTLTDLERVLDKDFLNLNSRKGQEIQLTNLTVYSFSGVSIHEPTLANDPNVAYEYKYLKKGIELINTSNYEIG